MTSRSLSTYSAGFIASAVIFYIASIFYTIPPQKREVRLAINPWPAYELLYLAQEVGIFDDLGLHIQLVEMRSLADIRRAFERGRVDAMCCTLIEAVEAIETSNVSGKVVLVTDFSDGGDALVARSDIAEMSALKGQRIAVETAALGSYLLHRALEKNGLRPNDVKVVPMEQVMMQAAFATHQIDAAISYPPFLQAIRKTGHTHTLFSSAEIPGEIADVVVISDEALEDPLLLKQLHKAWDNSLQYLKEHPEKAIQIMAERERIDLKSFSKSLSGLRLLHSHEQGPVLRSANFAKTIQTIQALVLPRDHSRSDPEHFLIAPQL